MASIDVQLKIFPDFCVQYEGLWYEVEKYWFAVEATASCVS